MKNNKVKIGFLGCGNMGSAIVESLLRRKIFSARQIGISESDSKRRASLKRKFGVVTFSDNASLVKSAEIILLAVKPQQMSEVLRDVSPELTMKHLILSIAAGLDTVFFEKHLPPRSRLIRIMPNMGVMVGQGASGLFAGKYATPQDKKMAQKIFASGGTAIFVSKENLLDSVTAISGSGPAFVFLFIQSLLDAGIQEGLSSEVAQQLILQTLKGSIEIAGNSKEGLPALIQKVASKGGTTEAGLKVLEEGQFSGLIYKTISAASRRAKELRCIS